MNATRFGIRLPSFLLKSDGGGGGGASAAVASADAVNYPTHMQNWHKMALNRAEDECVNNGSFESVNNWNLGAGWSIDGDNLVAATAISTAVTQLQGQQKLSIVAGVTYRVSYFIDSDPDPTGAIRICLGTAQGLGRTGSGQFTEIITCAGTDPAISFIPIGAFCGEIDSVSVVPHVTLAKSVTEAINEAFSENGNPYGSVTAYSPDSQLTAVSTAVNTFDTELGLLGSAGVASALAYAQANVPLSTLAFSRAQSAIDTLTANSISEFKRQVARTSSGLFDIGAVMTTQFHQTLAGMEASRRQTLGAQEVDIIQRACDMHVNSVLEMMNRYLSELHFEADAMRTNAVLAIDAAKLNITAKQDVVEFDLEHAIKAKLWDLELFAYGTQVLGGITGAATMPRAQTRRERLMGALTTSASTAMQTAVGTKSPALGIGAGVLTLAAQMYGMS